MKRLKIILFTGMDLIGQFIVSQLCRKLDKSRYSLYLIYPEQYKKGNSQLFEIQEKDFFQGTILHKYIYPFLDNLPFPESALCLTPEQLAQQENIFKYNLTREAFKGPGASVVKFIEELKPDGAISIRYPFIFRENLINAVQQKPNSFFWNIHSAPLPDYRGLSPMPWMLYDGKTNASFTLHKINKTLDTGDIIGINPQPIDPGKTVFFNLYQLCPAAIEMMLNAISMHSNNIEIPAISQKNSLKARYFGQLNTKDLQKLKKRGIKLVDRMEMYRFFLELFSPDGSGQFDGLEGILQKAYTDWET